MTYKEYTNKRQEEFNALPIFWAFSNEQLEKALAERGVSMDEAKDKVYRYGMGGFYLKSDSEIIRAYHSVDRNAELRTLMNGNLDFAYEAFEFEMYNHEYPINLEGDYDVCGCFGNCEFAEEKTAIDYLTEMGYSNDVIAQYRKAAKTVMANGNW